MSQDSVRNLGEYLRMIRNDRGLTQKEVAEGIGGNLWQISRWETSERLPALFWVDKIADFCELREEERKYLQDIYFLASRGFEYLPRLRLQKESTQEFQGSTENIGSETDNTIAKAAKLSFTEVAAMKLETQFYQNLHLFGGIDVVEGSVQSIAWQTQVLPHMRSLNSCTTYDFIDLSHAIWLGHRERDNASIIGVATDSDVLQFNKRMPEGLPGTLAQVLGQGHEPQIVFVPIPIMLLLERIEAATLSAFHEHMLIEVPMKYPFEFRMRIGAKISFWRLAHAKLESQYQSLARLGICDPEEPTRQNGPFYSICWVRRVLPEVENRDIKPVYKAMLGASAYLLHRNNVSLIGVSTQAVASRLQQQFSCLLASILDDIFQKAESHTVEFVPIGARLLSERLEVDNLYATCEPTPTWAKPLIFPFAAVG
jgi:transcriptional regulator with XRE-family HTH domain